MTNKKFQVAPASSFFVPRLVEIDSQWNPRSWSERLFQGELSNSAARIYGLFHDTILVGYLIAHVILDEAHIVSFGVDTEWRGQGGGRLLLNDFLRRVRFEGVRVVTLEVRARNVTARHLYESHGFLCVGIRRKYYSDNGEDAITMHLRLTN